MIHNDEKGKSIETKPEIMQLIKLAGKDIKTIIINYSFCFVSQRKRLRMLSKNMGNMEEIKSNF